MKAYKGSGRYSSTHSLTSALNGMTLKSNFVIIIKTAHRINSLYIHDVKLGSYVATRFI